MEFFLPYHITSKGKGDAQVVFHSSEAAAKGAATVEDVWWTRKSNDLMILKVEDNKLYFKEWQRDANGAILAWAWVEVPQA